MGTGACHGDLGRIVTRLRVGLAARVEREPTLLLALGRDEADPETAGNLHAGAWPDPPEQGARWAQGCRAGPGCQRDPLSCSECNAAEARVTVFAYLTPCFNDCGPYGQCSLLRRHGYLYAGCSCKAGERVFLGSFATLPEGRMHVLVVAFG